MRKTIALFALLLPLAAISQYGGVITSAMLVPHGGTATILNSPATTMDNPRWWGWVYTGGPVEFDCHIEFSSSGLVDSVTLHLPVSFPLATDNTFGVCYMESTVTGGNIQETCTWFIAAGTREIILHRQSAIPSGTMKFAPLRTMIRAKGIYH